MCAMHYANKFCIERDIDSKEVEILQKTEGSIENLKIITEVKFGANFPEKYKKVIIKAIEQCTVKKVIQSNPKFEIVLI
jgi:ribosomal protein S12 methylthiotransferase accessory factor